MAPPLTPSDATLALCSQTSTYPPLSKLLESTPSASPKTARSKLTSSLPGKRPNVLTRGWERFVSDGGMRVEKGRAGRSEEEKREERRRVLESSGWDKEGEGRPSDLFLEMYASVLLTTTHTSSPINQLLYTPSLLPSRGIVPLSIISPIPAILAHYYALIVLARTEILLFTNYWQVSDSSRTIGRALRELSKRVVEGGRSKVVVKLLFDRGTVRQLWKNHSPVEDGEEWDVLGIPRLKDLPGLDLQVINYHRPLIGTFHSKMMVVDREVALLNSNNIQDRPNVEMMLHLEGPIVEPLYETCLLSFHNQFIPPLPTLLKPPTPQRTYNFQESSRWLKYLEVSKAALAVKRILEEAHKSHERPNPRMRDLVRTMIERGAEQPPGPSWRESLSLSIAGMGLKDDEEDSQGEGWFSRRSSRMNSRRNSMKKSTGGGAESPKRTESPGWKHSEKPPVSPLSPHSISVGFNKAPLHPSVSFASPTATTTSNDDSKNAFKFEFEANNVPPIPKDERPLVSSHLTADDPEDMLADHDEQHVAKETESSKLDHETKNNLFTPGGADTEMNVMSDGEKIKLCERDRLSRLERLTEILNAGTLSQPQPSVEDSDEIDEFTPHILHREHKEVPMVLVNRRPRGMAGHQSLRTPQNAAWLAGFYSAKKRIFIQTPTYNAKPVVQAALDACRRGVEVIIYAGVGFNDKGESIPFQGGTNEQVASRMYAALRKESKQQYLKFFWYVGKDQSYPINAVHKQRNCHVKLAIFDDEVGIVGNGNQDTQSWYHSQEVNVMIDSKQICTDWIMALEHNQNTHLYGRLDDHGIWRDPQGRGLDYFDPKIGHAATLAKTQTKTMSEKVVDQTEASSENTDATRV